eukprot:364397-Chlamydomonas_euryale.AAC.22
MGHHRRLLGAALPMPYNMAGARLPTISPPTSLYVRDCDPHPKTGRLGAGAIECLRCCLVV